MPKSSPVAPSMGGDLYRIEPAAEKLQIKAKTLRNWMAAGRIGYVRFGRSVRVPVSEVNRVIAEGYRPARSA